MQRYEKYKDSGVDWIEEIPEHWQSINFRQLINVLTDFTANGSFGDLAKNVTYVDAVSYSKLIRLTDLRKNLENDGIYIDEKSHRYLKKSELFGGELLIANVGAYAGLACIMPNVNYKASLGPNMFLLKFNAKITNKFALYILNSSKYWEWLQITALSSAQPKLNKDNIRQLKIVLPPINEQQTIATFLDDKTAKIDQTIANKQKEIELLKERRQILIQKAVTKGLDDTVPLKDSGVDWIGEIPEHWEVRKLKYLTKYFKGFAFSSVDFKEEGIPIVKASNIKSWSIENISSFISLDNQNSKFDSFKLEEGDIIISTVGSKPAIRESAVGQLAIVNEEYSNSYLNQNTVCIRPKNTSVYKYFLKYVFVSNYMRNNFDKISLWIANQAYLEIDSILEIFITLPSISEQKEILEYIETGNEKIAKAILLKQQEIERLKEYKTVLIDNVVTGKVRVS